VGVALYITASLCNFKVRSFGFTTTTYSLIKFKVPRRNATGIDQTSCTTRQNQKQPQTATLL
jgi:hypothetical protein